MPGLPGCFPLQLCEPCCPPPPPTPLHVHTHPAPRRLPLGPSPGAMAERRAGPGPHSLVRETPATQLGRRGVRPASLGPCDLCPQDLSVGTSAPRIPASRTRGSKAAAFPCPVRAICPPPTPRPWATQKPETHVRAMSRELTVVGGSGASAERRVRHAPHGQAPRGASGGGARVRVLPRCLRDMCPLITSDGQDAVWGGAGHRPPPPGLSGPRGGAVPRRSRDGGAGAPGRRPSGHSSVLPPGCGEARTALRARLDRHPLSAGRERLSSSSGTTPHLPPECRQLPRSHLKTAASFALSVQLRAACARPGASPRRLWGLSLAPPPRARPRAPGAKGTHAPRSRSTPRRGGGGGARGGNSWGRRARVRGPCRGPRPVDAAGRGTRWPRSRCCCGLPRSRAFGGNSLRFCTDGGGRTSPPVGVTADAQATHGSGRRAGERGDGCGAPVGAAPRPPAAWRLHPRHLSWGGQPSSRREQRPPGARPEC